jgi:hypothetical protein
MGWIPPPDGIAMCQGDVGHITGSRKYPLNKSPSSGWIWQSGFFRFTAVLRMAGLLFARSCHGVRCWHFSRANGPVWWPWRPVPRPTTGHVSLALSGTTSGWCRLPRSNLSSSARRWDGCRPPQTASRCAKVVVFNATKRRGRQMQVPAPLFT